MLLLAVAAILFVCGAQAALFHKTFAPRIAQANAALFDLIVEKAQRNLYAGIAAQIQALGALTPDTDGEDPSLADAWSEFGVHFATAPREAIDTFIDQLPGLTAGVSNAGDEVTRVTADLDRLKTIYADSYKDLLADLKRPPLYLWPTAAIYAGRSGYRQAVTLNRALYLAQIGEIGTARVMLAGLNATADDPELLGTIYYTLGRLQFELFMTEPDAEYFTQSVQYLRQSLDADPGMPLAKRLLDYLLSLSQTAAAPQAAEGRPETPSEGQGAAVSAEKRVF